MVVEFSKAVALLLALCLVQGFIARRWENEELLGLILSGFLFGSICVIGMMTPIEVTPGVIFDARSVVLSMSGLFGGPLVAGIAAVIAGGYRLWLGGGGAPVGIAVVVSCVLLGLAYRHCHRRGWLQIGIPHLLAFGLLVHLVEVFLFTFLPDNVVEDVMNNVALPLVLIFTPATALLGTLLQATELQIQTGKSLARSERRFKDVAEAASDWFWEMNSEFQFTYHSERYFEITGFRPEDKVGTKRTHYVSPTDLEEDAEKWMIHKADLEAHKPFKNFEYSFTAREGHLLHVRISGTPVFDPDGGFNGYIGTGSDITKRKKSEETSRQLAMIVESTDNAVILANPDGTITYWNTAAERIYGYSAKEIIGKSISMVAPLDRPDELANMIAAINKGEKIGHYETVRRRKDGSIVEVSATISPIEDEKGNVTAIAAIVHDITELIQTRLQLQQAQKMEAMGQLTGGVAHDFNNLLAIIIGNTEFLAERLGDDDGPLRSVRRAATRGAELVEQMLAFSRTQSLRPQNIDINAIITEMSHMLTRTLGETIEIEIRPAPDLWWALADPSQLESAILNLAINARDSMPNGGTLIIESSKATLDEDYTAKHMELKPGEYVMLAVSDTGTGMSAEVLKHGFEPFFTTKDVGAGSGLGLSMVYGFIKQSGGDIMIHSEEGKGTKIKLYLPRATVAPAVERKPAGDEVQVAQGETVLVVEDQPDLLRIAVKLLDSLGYQVMEAATGAAALEQLRSAPDTHLLLTDVGLPGGMNGPGLAVEAKRCAPGIRVLYMSGYSASTIMKQGQLDAGAELLPKPFLRADLAKVVRRVLDS